MLKPSLSQQEDGDDNDSHHGDPEGVSPLHLLTLVVAALTGVETVRQSWSVKVWSVRSMEC